ncbi:MAG: PAS domain S-box protein, partial [Acidobacteriia bacterium]|nr:PAS domain S-box protein [Terriglobia bacterium]
MSVPSPLAKALRASEQHYRNLFENASDIIFTCDLAGRFTSLNKAGERITGYTRGEASQMSLLQVVAPEKHELARYALERAAKGETPPLGEWEIVPKDRRRVLLEVSIQPIYQNGKPEAVQGIARDVTERRRMEEALRESEGRNRDLVEHSQDLMCTHDLTGKLLSVNSAPAKMLGYTPEELLKIPMRDLLAPEVRKDFDVYLETIRREGTAQGLMVVQTRTGERRIWEYGNTLRTAG